MQVWQLFTIQQTDPKMINEGRWAGSTIPVNQFSILTELTYQPPATWETLIW